jgi:hypothetical protein
VADKDYLSGLPQGGGTSSSSGMIGVPDGYSVPANDADFFKPGGSMSTGGMLFPTGQPHQPQYEDGSENVVRRMSVENLARLQSQMARVGLIGPSTKFRVGIPDPTTVTAYKKLLTIANNYAISDVQALDFLAENPEATGAQAVGADGSTAGGPTRSVHKQVNDPVFTDPLTARAVLRQTLEDRLGRAPTSDEYQRLRKQLSNSEGGQDVTTSITTTDGQGNSKTRSKPSDTTTDPSADVIADDMSRRGALGKEANTRQIGNGYYDAIASLIGG